MFSRFHTAVFAFTFLSLSFSFFISAGQGTIPYSRYGLGLLQQPEPAFLRGWGSLSAAYHNAYNVNYSNPASYSYLAYTSFDAGLFGNFLRIESADSSASFGDGGVANFSLAFPLMKEKWGASIGIAPFSRVNYDLLQTNDSVPGLGATYNEFKGSGGTYAFYIGSGYKWKNLSFGINANYLFGKLDYSSILAFPDTANAYNTLRDESRMIHDFMFNGGIQYRFIFGKEKNYFLDLGASGNLKTNVSADRNLQWVRFFYFGGVVQPKDTISDVQDENGVIVLPATLSAGIIFSKANRFMVGLNYDVGQWGDYTSFGEKDLTTNSWHLNLGGQYIPNSKSYTQYWKLVAYRAGFSYGKNYLQFDGQDFMEYEIDAGAGFPLKRVISELSLSAEYAHLGKLDVNPLTISQLRVTLGVTLNDRWFQKRKYD